MRYTNVLLDTFIKHFPKKFIDKEKSVLPKKVFGNRFGAPDIPYYSDNADSIKPENYIYTEHRPWEIEAKTVNRDAAHSRAQAMSKKRDIVERYSIQVPRVTPLPDDKWFYFRGDRVQVLVGKDKGRQGVILKVVRERNWIFVEGLHCEYKYSRTPGLQPVLSLEEQPLMVPDEVQLVDPKDLRATEVEWRWNEQGDRVRVGLRTGYMIPMPLAAAETYDYKTPLTYKENAAKDTTRDNVLKQTYEPKLASFEEELMELYGITDKRPYGKTYWY